MSKRAPYEFSEVVSDKNYWRGPGEKQGTPEFLEQQGREFPDGAHTLDPVSRRSFIQLMGASAGLAGMVACRRPEEKIVPYAQMPEHMVPGRPEYYATAMAWDGTAVGLLVESHMGRPTKVEGNPRHSESGGASGLYAQALALELYDSERSQHPTLGGEPRTWADAAGALEKAGADLQATGGQKLVVLTTNHRSPTTARMLKQLSAALPKARVLRHDPVSRQNIRQGVKAATGADLEPVLNTAAAQVLLTLDADIFATDGGVIRNARGFADGRRVAKPGDAMNRLYAVESRFSVTGANADHRLRVPSRQVSEFAYALAAELVASHGINLGEAGAAVASYKGQAFESRKPWVKAVARDLAQNRGACLVAAGRGQPPAVHALVALMNHALGNTSKTVSYAPGFDAADDGPQTLVELAAAIGRGEVETLVILGGNPAFTAPVDADFETAIKRVPLSFHLSFEVNETSAACRWHLNRAHDFEGWSDVAAQDGTLSVVQPLIAPIFDGRTDAEMLSALVGKPQKAHALVKETWVGMGAAGDDKAWRRILHDGVFKPSAAASVAPAFQTAPVAQAIAAAPPPGADGYEVTFHPDGHAWDGRFANHPWLQELPDPMTKVSWDNGALLSPETAKKLGVEENQLITITIKGAKPLTLAVTIAPGQAADSIAVTLGQGRRKVGMVGEEIGYDTYQLRTAAAPWLVQGAQVVKVEGEHKLARTQEHHSMEGRPLVREATLTQFNKEPDYAQKMVKHPGLLSLFPDREYNGHKWGMVIDLNTCVGCSVCMVACQAENNIPVVGKWGVAMSREMHWIRVDRYFEGDSDEDPAAVFQPLPCQHCELAPCEQVCPVAATTHSPEGLNDMAYNRCVGTRYCANNCPYKVRRFNFHNYAKDFSVIKNQAAVGFFFKKDIPELRRMQFNPDVTVRERGVMEKCSYCVQRINAAKLDAKRDGAELKDGAVVSACQQACPTGAIHFGDLNLADSDVVKNAANPRNFSLLGELNVRPRTTYLAKIRNPNLELQA